MKKLGLIKGIKRYFRKSVINVNYELKYDKEVEKHEKTKIKLSEANDRIRFLEKELEITGSNQDVETDVYIGEEE